MVLIMKQILTGILNFLDAFFFGEVYAAKCHFCSFTLTSKELEDLGEDEFVDSISNHDCLVRSRHRISLFTKKLGFYKDEIVFSKVNETWE